MGLGLRGSGLAFGFCKDIVVFPSLAVERTFELSVSCLGEGKRGCAAWVAVSKKECEISTWNKRN
jgi:hypothetical protein